MALFRCGTQTEPAKHIESIYGQVNARIDGLSSTNCNLYSSLFKIWDIESGGNIFDQPTQNAGGEFTASDFLAGGGCNPRHACFVFMKVNYSDGTSEEYGEFHGSRIVSKSGDPKETFITRNECETDECPVIPEGGGITILPYYVKN